MAAVGARNQFGPPRGIDKNTPTKSGNSSTAARINTNGAEVNTHQFTLILSGVAEITPELADALYTATGGDIEFNMRNDVAYIEVDRDADTLHEAVSSAITQIEGAGVGVRV